MRYNRLLDDKAAKALQPGGVFSFLIAGIPISSEDPYALDIQIREDNKLMYYHGTTSLLTIKFPGTSSEVEIIASAYKSYGQKAECSNEYKTLMRTWRPEEKEALRNAFQAYLPMAIKAAHRKNYRNRKEGYWQNTLCVRFGRQWKPGDRWLIIDRECVLGFANSNEKNLFYKSTEAFKKVRDDLQGKDPKKWGEPKGKSLGDELDMLALNQAGELCVIELKYGASNSGIYWGPLQVGLYHCAFAEAIGRISKNIETLVRQKIKLGLLPENAQTLIDRNGLAKVQRVLAITEPKPSRSSYEKLIIVERKMAIAESNTTTPSTLQVVGIHRGSNNGDLIISNCPNFDPASRGVQGGEA